MKASGLTARARPLASAHGLRHKVAYLYGSKLDPMTSAAQRKPGAAQRKPAAIHSDAELIGLLETLYNSRNPTRRWLHCTRRDWIAGKIREYALERPGRALEAGFGAGVYLPTLAACFTEVIATDLNQAHLEHARALIHRHPNLRLAIDDLTVSRLPEASFDFVLCTEVLEHIADTARVISGIRRLLKPGGILMLSTPQRHSLMELACKVAFLPGIVKLVRRIYGEAVFEPGHINLLSSRELRTALEHGGFRIRERFQSGLYLPLIAEFGGSPGLSFARWLEPRLRFGPLGFLLWTQYYVAQVG
jgi:2-polyprenyl-3-methyl-5-hydroxy-6-metoxy-1,4-benzoquinol methylase